MKLTKHTILEIIDLTPGTFILRLDRKGIQFEPGQYVVLRMPHEQKGREYSIFSATTDDYLDFLIREIPVGEFSPYLHHMKSGNEIDLEGPKGYFVLDNRSKQGNSVLLIASGTGISPFHSFVKSYTNLNYKVLHGVRFANEAYGRESFNPENYLVCSSRRDDGDYYGRVTNYLEETTVDKDTICYLCGNSNMIDEVTTILENKDTRGRGHKGTGVLC